MNFELSKEHRMARDLFRRFAEKEARPLAQEVDENERFPSETVEKMARSGFLGIPCGKEWGGQGCDTLTYVLCVEELSRVCATTGVVVSAHTSLACDPIEKYGTEAQKRKYLPELLAGRKLGAFALTEPGAGTDASGQQTRAVLEGENYRLNGSKIFITNAGQADVYIVFAMTDKSLGTKGISAFIVEKGFPGFSVGKKELKMGIRGSSTCELIFEDCVVPKENLLGKEGKGFSIAMGTLDGGRIGIAAQALGIAQGALDETVSYVKERTQFGKPVSHALQLSGMRGIAGEVALFVWIALKVVQFLLARCQVPADVLPPFAAHPTVRAAAAHVVPSNVDDGVGRLLSAILAGRTASP